MTLKDDLRMYKVRWAEVETIIDKERRSAPLELRWKQLNTAFGMGKILELPREDSIEMEVIERWAKIKEKATNRHRKV